MHRLQRYGLLLLMLCGLCDVCVCVCVCLSVGHNYEPCWNDWTIQNAIWDVDCESWIMLPLREGAIFGGGDPCDAAFYQIFWPLVAVALLLPNDIDFSTGMGDHLWAGIPPRYVTNHVNSACIPPGSRNRVPASAGVRAGMSPLPGGR